MLQRFRIFLFVLALFFSAGYVVPSFANSNLPDEVAKKLQDKHGGRAVSVTKEGEELKVQMLDGGKVTIVYLNSTTYAELRVEK